jgi:hypothetical protein
MPSEKQIKAIRLYASLMEEAKTRMAAIDSALAGDTNLPEILADEFCTLQLRMLCELIALGCLVAHGDIRTTRNLRKAKYADDIVNQLEVLNPHFYPQPVRQVDTGSGGLGIEDIASGFLTKAELCKLVGKCGANLHRGSAKSLLSPRTLTPKAIAEWARKIRTLLDIHWFRLPSGEPHYLCSMTGGANGGVGVQFLGPNSEQ